MKHLLLILGLILMGITSYGQTTISRDSIMSNSEFIGRYTIESIGGVELRASVIMSVPFNDTQRNQFESTLKKMMFERGLFEGMRYSFQYFVDLNKISPSQIAGMKFKEAGKAYNGAAALSIIGAVGGSAVVLSGYPIAGSIITLSSSIIAFIVQITGNNKLIKGGESLQRQK